MKITDTDRIEFLKSNCNFKADLWNEHLQKYIPAMECQGVVVREVIDAEIMAQAPKGCKLNVIRMMGGKQQLCFIEDK